MLHKLQNSMVIRCKKSQHRPLLIAERTDPKDGLGSVTYIFTLGLDALYRTATSLFILLHTHQKTVMHRPAVYRQDPNSHHGCFTPQQTVACTPCYKVHMNANFTLYKWRAVAVQVQRQCRNTCGPEISLSNPETKFETSSCCTHDMLHSCSHQQDSAQHHLELHVAHATCM